MTRGGARDPWWRGKSLIARPLRYESDKRTDRSLDREAADFHICWDAVPGADLQRGGGGPLMTALATEQNRS